MADGTTQEERVVVTAGEKNRRVVVEFSPKNGAPQPRGASPSSPSSTLPTSVYVLGGLGAVALGSFAFFGVKSLSRGDDLKETCAPRCSDDDANAVHRDALIADVSLAIGIVAVGAATWILLTHRAAASALVVAPTPHGSVVGWHARF
jgi:hypothetical protein